MNISKQTRKRDPLKIIHNAEIVRSLSKSIFMKREKNGKSIFSDVFGGCEAVMQKLSYLPKTRNLLSDVINILSSYFKLLMYKSEMSL